MHRKDRNKSGAPVAKAKPRAAAALPAVAADAITVPFASVTDRDVAKAVAPPAAATGDDDLMSQAQVMPTLHPAPKAWKDRIEAARLAWIRLDSSELLGSDGDAARLAKLLEQRYAMPPADAQRQVADFLAGNTIRPVMTS